MSVPWNGRMVAYLVLCYCSFPAAHLLLWHSESGVSIVAPVQSRSGFAIMWHHNRTCSCWSAPVYILLFFSLSVLPFENDRSKLSLLSFKVRHCKMSLTSSVVADMWSCFARIIINWRLVQMQDFLKCMLVKYQFHPEEVSSMILQCWYLYSCLQDGKSSSE